jgi:hypothetical protein
LVEQRQHAGSIREAVSTLRRIGFVKPRLNRNDCEFTLCCKRVRLIAKLSARREPAIEYAGWLIKLAKCFSALCERLFIDWQMKDNKVPK